MQKIISESLRYWEPRRLVYNAVLTAVVLSLAAYHHVSISTLAWQPLLGLLVMAVVANVLYCSAYVVDVFIQLSDYQQLWKRNRWLVLAAGTALAVAIFFATRD